MELIEIMAGATAGTATLRVPNKSTSELKVVTLTVNNSCNLSCNHCYLQYNGDRRTLSKEDEKMVLDCRHDFLAIVGKEPTFHPELVGRLVNRSCEMGRKTSIITNGFQLQSLSQETLAHLDFLDVSFDGGPKTYSQVRKGDFGELISKIKQAKNLGTKSVNALHTLYAENIDNLEDMVRVRDYVDFDTLAFSIYKVPHNHGSVRVTYSPLVEKVLPILVENRQFMESDNTKLLLTNADFVQGEPDKILERAESLGLVGKIHYTDDPLKIGVIRVTYDGKVLAPHDATHPLIYGSVGYSLQDSRFGNLNDIFRQIQQDKISQKSPLLR